eukprot:13256404-Alexandrium_andersonii.AAC.1
MCATPPRRKRPIPRPPGTRALRWTREMRFRGARGALWRRDEGAVRLRAPARRTPATGMAKLTPMGRARCGHAAPRRRVRAARPGQQVSAAT